MSAANSIEATVTPCGKIPKSKHYRQVPGLPIGCMQGNVFIGERERMIYLVPFGTRRVFTSLLELKKHVEKYPEWGVDPRRYSNLATFQRESAKLLLEAEQEVEDGACRWGFIVDKVNAESTNRYVNTSAPPTAIEEQKQQQQQQQQ